VGIDAPRDPHPPQQAVHDAVALALAEDLLALGDLTAALLPSRATGHLVIAAREEGVVAGSRCAEEAFGQVDDRCCVTWHVPEGGAILPGSVIAEISGPLRSLLSAERTALNFLRHLSGVASLTRRFVVAVAATGASAQILDTRKTTPGLRALEKAAVRAGGGRNHRSSLSDGVMVKDNHLSGMSITDAVTSALRSWPGRMVEVECDRLDQVAEAVRAGATAVMLDNMTPDATSEGVAMIRALPGGERVMIEASGTMRLDEVGAYARSGVDWISVGALTHSAPALDFGLDFVINDKERG
jgi:nicotinate-nucleotide pyrophosphorylase (carboxylating)